MTKESTVHAHSLKISAFSAEKVYGLRGNARLTFRFVSMVRKHMPPLCGSVSVLHTYLGLTPPGYNMPSLPRFRTHRIPIQDT